MQRTPTTTDAGVKARRYRAGQDRPSGTADKGISEEHVGQVENGPEPGIDDKRPTEADEYLVGFFRLLLEIDRRINPGLYEYSIHDATRRDDEAGRLKKAN